MLELAGLFAEALRLHGFEVELSHDGLGAFNLIQTRVYHLGLFDIDLPDISGFEVVRRARSAGLLGATRIVFCSGGYVEERQSQALQFPGSVFIAKPFTIKKLLTTVADALRAPPTSGSV